MKILACGAHPDDVEIACGATLARAIFEGHSVEILDLTRGELGSNGDPKLRAEEADKAGHILGVTSRQQAGLPDGALNARDESQRRQVVEWLRHFSPDLLIIPARENRHPDHDQAHLLLKEGSFLAGLKHYEAKGRAMRPRVVYETMERRLFRPDFVVDVGSFREKKELALRAYKSQFIRDEGQAETLINDPAFLESIRSRDKFFGELAGCEWGEPFKAVELMRVDRISALLPGERNLLNE
jgi:N-acetylglucosamine malate deacetylase 1